MQKDGISNIHPVGAIFPAAAGTDNTPIVGAIIDGQGYNSLAYVIQSGVNTDTNAVFTVLLEDGDDANLADNAAVTDNQLVGTESLASFTFAEDNQCFKLGYVGSKRYTRLTITPSGNDSGNIFVTAVAILGDPYNAPCPNPPE